MPGTLNIAGSKKAIPMPGTALTAGSTGLVGSDCLRSLLASPEYASVTALVRRPGGITHPKLREQIVNFERLDDLPAAENIFCALGTTIRKAGSQAEFRKIDFEYPRRLAERSLQLGARQFVLVSSVGANAKSKNFYLRTKGELEDALRALPFEALHIFRPSFLVGERKESRPGERFGIGLARATQFVLFGNLRRYRLIQAEVVAKAMVNAAHAGISGVHVYEYDQIVGLAQQKK